MILASLVASTDQGRIHAEHFASNFHNSREIKEEVKSLAAKKLYADKNYEVIKLSQLNCLQLSKQLRA